MPEIINSYLNYIQNIFSIDRESLYLAGAVIASVLLLILIKSIISFMMRFVLSAIIASVILFTLIRIGKYPLSVDVSIIIILGFAMIASCYPFIKRVSRLEGKGGRS